MPIVALQKNNSAWLRLVVIVFLLILWLPAVVHMFGMQQGDSLQAEKRKKASWPPTALLHKDFTEYTTQVNKYLDDHIGLRKHLLGLYAKMRYRVLGVGASKQATIGKNGWLFLSKQLTVKNGRTRPPISSAAADGLIASLNQINESVKAYGGSLLFILVPDKASVYPEHLPNHLDLSDSERRAKPLIELSAKLEMPFLDLLAPMQAAKTRGQLYHKSDTHWGQLGSFVAYQQIVQSLQVQGYQFPSIDWQDLQPDKAVYLSGDLSKLLRLPAEFRERVDIVTPPKRPTSDFAWTDDEAFSIMLIGDSFAAQLIEFLPSSFSHLRFVHHRFTSIPVSKIEQYKPDVVVIEIVERQVGKPLRLY